MFINEIKSRYEILYHSVQPIPYVKDRMYSIDKVFVESGVEYLVTSTDASVSENWKQLHSHHELVGENVTSSSRAIIEGNPGYGKSTIALQLVYDWCNSVSKSPLRSIKLLVFLRLRQLGGISSIYEAIRRFLLPKDSKLNDDEIKHIIEKCSSVVLLLDGYDEYLERYVKDNYISRIIKKDIFVKTIVLLTTRSSCLPIDRAPQTCRVRLTGFEESARDEYIRKAVVGDNDVAFETIKSKLQENPVLGEICEVPLFFVMFAHITHENKNLPTFSSVTEFFQFMMKCLHGHMRNKSKMENAEEFLYLESNHTQLDAIAFKALKEENQLIAWTRKKLKNQLGKAAYDYYVKMGILIEEEDPDISQDLTLHNDTESTTEVRFYHKLFQEWYAAHHLAKQITKLTTRVSRCLANLDVYELQYLYRLACGINQTASSKILKHLQKTKDGQKFAILCAIEQERDSAGLFESVKMLVAQEVTINISDSRLLQKSTLQILEYASKNGVSHILWLKR